MFLNLKLIPSISTTLYPEKTSPHNFSESHSSMSDTLGRAAHVHALDLDLYLLEHITAMVDKIGNSHLRQINKASCQLMGKSFHNYSY